TRVYSYRSTATGTWDRPSIGVDQSFQCLKQLGITLDQRLASGSGVPDSPNGEGALRKALDGPIDGRARKTSNAGADGNTSSSQLLGVERSDQMLLSLIQVRKQRVEFMLKFFCCAHAGSIAQRALCVIVIVFRALTGQRLKPKSTLSGPHRSR